MHVLLISSSVAHGSGYLDHAEAAIGELLDGVRRVLFVPWALRDHDAYATKVRDRFAAMGREVVSIHAAGNPRRAVEDAEAIFIGGGNTFRLLAALYDAEIIAPIRSRAEGGMPYMGSSAGSNVAGPTIMTTNDMPIVYPPSFAALSLVAFQINPHYLDPDPTSTHKGETREQRIREYHEVNDFPVLGLREAAMLRVDGTRATLLGTAGARLFRRGVEPEEIAPGASLDSLLGG